MTKTHEPAIHKPVQLATEIASYLRELILTGRLRNGEPLKIDGLSKQLDVSATPVREALQLLHSENFTRFEPRRGYQVGRLVGADIRDIYWMQAQIAGELAARAAAVIDASGVRELESMQESMRDALASRPAITGSELDGEIEELNHQFHRMVNLAADSPKLTWLLSVLVRYAPRQFYSTISGWEAATLEDHQDVISACRASDPEAARLAMQRHIQHAGTLLAEHLTAREDAGPG